MFVKAFCKIESIISSFFLFSLLILHYGTISTIFQVRSITHVLIIKSKLCTAVISYVTVVSIISLSLSLSLYIYIYIYIWRKQKNKVIQRWWIYYNSKSFLIMESFGLLFYFLHTVGFISIIYLYIYMYIYILLYSLHNGLALLHEFTSTRASDGCTNQRDTITCGTICVVDG